MEETVYDYQNMCFGNIKFDCRMFFRKHPKKRRLVSFSKLNLAS